MTTTADTQPLYDRERSERRAVAVAGVRDRVRRRWPLVLVGLVLAVAIAAVTDERAEERHIAEAQIYLGTPLTPTGNLLAVAETQMSTAIGLATSREYVRAAADAADVQPGDVRAGLRARQLEAPVASKQNVQAQILVLTVELEDPETALTAVSAIARQLVTDANGYATAKQRLLKRQVRSATESLDRRRDLRERAETQLASSGPDGFEVWAAIADAANANEELAELKLAEVEEQLNMLESVETTRTIAGPDVARAPSTARSSSLLAAAALGALLGLLVALLWPTRRSTTNAT